MNKCYRATISSGIDLIEAYTCRVMKINYDGSNLRIELNDNFPEALTGDSVVLLGSDHCDGEYVISGIENTSELGEGRTILQVGSTNKSPERYHGYESLPVVYLKRDSRYVIPNLSSDVEFLTDQWETTKEEVLDQVSKTIELQNIGGSDKTLSVFTATHLNCTVEGFTLESGEDEIVFDNIDLALGYGGRFGGGFSNLKSVSVKGRQVLGPIVSDPGNRGNIVLFSVERKTNE